jgi:DNA-binding CsgD family transcriptional regulator
MEDDNAKAQLDLSPEFQRYAQLYPSAPARLRAILGSRDPQIRARVAVLRRAAQLRDTGRLGRLAASYHLTAAEARVALHIIDGGSIASYAEGAALSRGTIRSHLKAVFGKMRVSRQAELVLLGQQLL